MRALVLALLCAVPAAAQSPDTARATAELAISFEPGSIITRGDTTLVYVGVTHDSDSLQAAVDRASLALQAAILANNGSQPSSTPSWFYGGVLALAGAAILTWAFKDTETNVTVTQSQEQSAGGTTDGTTTTTTTTTTERFPWCWPPGHCKRKRGGEDE